MVPPSIAGSLVPPPIAATIYALGIAGLFYLDRDPEGRVSKALWVPALWIFLASSRSVSVWLGLAASVDADKVYLEGNPVDRVVYTVLLIAGLIVVIGRIEGVLSLVLKNVPILLFFLFCAVSIVWSDFPLVAFKRWTKAIGDLVMVLIIVTEPDPMAALKRLITRQGFLLFPLSVLFIKYYPNLGTYLTPGWEMTFIGVTTQKNCLGLDCMLWGIGFLWIFRAVYRDRGNPTRRRRLVAYGATLSMLVWSLWMSDSMTSIAALALASGVMFLAARPLFVRWRALVHGLVLAVLGISLFAVFFQPGGGLLQQLGRDPTLTGRTEIWDAVLSIPTNPWVGAGFESFWLGDRLYTMRHSHFGIPINEAHNGYIEVYLNLGWTGITLLALLLLTGYRKVIAAFREDPERGTVLLGFFLLALFESITEAAFRMMTPSWIFLLLAIIAATRSLPSEAAVRTASESGECESQVLAYGGAGVGVHQ